MMILLTIVLMGLGSYAMRAVFILLLAGRTFPPLALQALEYVAPSVMGALVVTMLLNPEAGSLPSSAEWAGLLTAAVVAVLSRNHVYVLVSAMGVYWAWGYLF